MTDVKGYTDQSEERKRLVNLNKEVEEIILRRIEELRKANITDEKGKLRSAYSHRDLEEAKMRLIDGFMWLNRAIFQPQRISLPEDDVK